MDSLAHSAEVHMKQSSASSSKSHRSNFSTTPRRKVIWASQRFRGRFGEYIGIALEAYRLSVAIHTPAGPRWVPANEALSAAEAESWAASGFNRR
jgi:hypothetical protein